MSKDREILKSVRDTKESLTTQRLKYRRFERECFFTPWKKGKRESDPAEAENTKTDNTRNSLFILNNNLLRWRKER